MPFFLTGCSSTPSEQATPTAAAQARPAATTRAGPDGYPNLNLPVEAAAPQIDDEERRQHLEDFERFRQRQQNGVDPGQAAAEAERLRELARQIQEQRAPRAAFDDGRLRLVARTHAQQILAAIEASGQ